MSLFCFVVVVLLPRAEQVERIGGERLEKIHDNSDENGGVLGVVRLEQVVVDLGAERQVAENGRDRVGREDEHHRDHDGLGELAEPLALQTRVDGHRVHVTLIAEADDWHYREHICPIVWS